MKVFSFLDELDHDDHLYNFQLNFSFFFQKKLWKSGRSPPPNIEKYVMLGKVSTKKTKKWLDFSIQAGWLGSAGGQNPTKTIIVFKKKYKDDQNGLIHPEN